MAISFNRKIAEKFLRKQANKATLSSSDPKWIDKIEQLSELCTKGAPKTHIAFLGTTLLAKSMNPDVDLYSIKPTHRKNYPNAYSARSLAHSVLVPVCAELGINLGVTGREPLNNQPYFRMKWLNDDTPVRRDGQPAFNLILDLITKLSSFSMKQAQEALRAFIVVRKKYQPRYIKNNGIINISPTEIIDCIVAFTKEVTEGGKIAQAIAAGVLDVIEGQENVISGRINDPDRNFPGDVCIKLPGKDSYQKAFEVRDKNVSISDIHIFGNKCIQMDVREAAILMVSPKQKKINVEALADWAQDFGIGITLFFGWNEFVSQVLFWSEEPKPDAAKTAVKTIHERLIKIEASVESVEKWLDLVNK